VPQQKEHKKMKGTNTHIGSIQARCTVPVIHTNSEKNPFGNYFNTNNNEKKG
jgi:hypothetical protein